ncbi:hypothetical protein KUTeg_015090 [Tegillarca granosa]|uniref:Gamma-glutamylcyclotransferase family protein n=1 Tax=Tegillarca granosa TaxID=220873 RepID=A0ABQ9ERK6_TEGGR|nr:hypothetical protein KUTeg_015090 [Tegillarca granosa]
MHLVFVYGTLKTGQPNNYLLDNPENGYKKYIGKGVTEEKFPLVIASQYNIPFMLPAAGNEKGQVNKLENHPHWYQRIKTQIIRSESESTNQNVECWCYFLTDFIPDLLKLQCHSSYDYKGNHGLAYIAPKDRDLTADGVRKILMSVKSNVS